MLNDFGFAQAVSNKIVLGRYRHYNGKEYQVLNIVTHSETQEPLVLYKPLYLDELGNQQNLKVKPLAKFNRAVEIEDKIIPRFALVIADV